MQMGISLGHSLVFHQIGLVMHDYGRMSPNLQLPLEVWLAHLKPPLHRYAEALRLVCPTAKSAVDILSVKKEDVERLPVSTGHRRTLWSYIVAARTHFLDPL
jgi:hypothetical protein